VSTDAPVSPRAGTPGSPALGFDLDRPWRLDDRVAVRPACMAAGIGDGALPAYQRALGTLARSQMIARRAGP
jgi:hypothetical protein